MTLNCHCVCVVLQRDKNKVEAETVRGAENMYCTKTFRQESFSLSLSLSSVSAGFVSSSQHALICVSVSLFSTGKQ